MAGTTRTRAPHRDVLLALLVGVLAGLGVRAMPAALGIGLVLEERDGGLAVAAVTPGTDAEAAGVTAGWRLVALVAPVGGDGERRDTGTREELDAALAGLESGERVVLELEAGAETRVAGVRTRLDPESPRARVLAPLAFGASVFLALLQMLIVPVVFASIVAGIAGLRETRDLGRIGAKTFGWYIGTSLVAILTGLVLSRLIAPGTGAEIGLSLGAADSFADIPSLWQVFGRIVPSNLFESFSDNGAILQVIFAALLAGIALTRLAEPHRTRMTDFAVSAFEAVMSLSRIVLVAIPFGVAILLAKIVGESGMAPFAPLALYMATVVAGLAIHGLLTLPVLVAWLGRVRPAAHARAVGPALLTAFSTSSSSATLPVTLQSTEERAGVSKRVTSFVVPLGATINMDGTALYECVGVVFLAQAYASLPGSTFELDLAAQAVVVVTALLASIGAAGVPSAGLVMMLTILSALGLPPEGAAILLAVDRPLDMLRSAINVWSDTCAAAVIARSEGETIATARTRGPAPGEG